MMKKKQAQQWVSEWMMKENNRVELKNLVAFATKEYCYYKKHPDRHNIDRDIGIAEKLNAEVQNGNFQALLNHVRGKGKPLGPSQGKNSLMDFMSEAVLGKVLDDAEFEQDKNIQVDIKPREVLEPGLKNLIAAIATEKKEAMKEGMTKIRGGKDNKPHDKYNFNN
ncbi:MAG: hypothetical protein QNK11_05220 [Legionella sp.]|nr:hypothetical protein [Legionella sp.]